jgi:Nitroreductase family
VAAPSSHEVDPHGGMPLMEALAARRSSREFAPDPLPLPLLAGVLWAADGVNRPEGGRTAPTAINAQEIDVFAALPTGAFLYDAAKNALTLVAATDVRRVTGVIRISLTRPRSTWSMWRTTRACEWCRPASVTRTLRLRPAPSARTCTCLPPQMVSRQ